MTKPAPRRVALGAVLLLVGGCADRGLAAGPPPGTSAGTWAAVTVAAVAAAVVLAALIVLPAMRPGGSVLGAWVLALQAGGVAVTSAIIIGAAIRSEQLLDHPPEAEQAASLLRLSTLDGRNSGFFALIVLVTLALGALVVALLTLAARFAADTDPVERAFAAGVLVLEIAASVVCGVVVGLGVRHLGFVLPAAGLPVLVVGAIAAWPRSPAPGPAAQE